MLSSPTTAREHKPPSSAVAAAASTPHKMMEDVWKDINININLTSLTDHHATSKGAKFQDFLQLRPSPPPPPSPLTALCLATRPESHIDLQLAQPQPHPTSTCKRPPTCAGDTRHARLIKNRESAARSRARKQAYEFELQQKIKQLQEENARLRRQQQLLRETAANKQKGGKGNLYRTYTAPF